MDCGKVRGNNEHVWMVGEGRNVKLGCKGKGQIKQWASFPHKGSPCFSGNFEKHAAD